MSSQATPDPQPDASPSVGLGASDNAPTTGLHLAGKPGLLSVVIPAYNAADFLEDCVASLQAQTYRPLEIIIVDDGSTDRTPALLDRLAQEGAEAGVAVRPFAQANAGASAARNRAIELAEGEYIGFIDADDRWLPEKAARQIAMMDADPSIGMSCSGWRIIDEAGHEKKRVGGAPAGEITFEDLLLDNVIGTPSSIILRRGALRDAGTFDVTMRYCEDLDFFLRVAAQPQWRVANVDAPLIERREREGQLTRDFEAMRAGWLEVFNRFRASDPERVEPLAATALGFNERRTAFLAYSAGDFKAARHYTWKAWREAPLALVKEKRAYPTTLAAFLSYFPGPLHRALDKRLRALREG